MKELDQRLILLQQIGALLMLGGAAVFLLMPVWAAILYSAGVLLYAPLRMLQRYDGQNFVIRRLRRQQLLGQLAFLCAACCMIMQAFNFGFARRNEWVVCLVIGCILELYTTFRIPAELKKEK
jgi:drug/metabolite transporter (DMT)-like permease